MTGVVVSSSLVLAPTADNFTLDNPIVGYQTLANASNITATTAQSGFPASNMTNPSTYLKWKAESGSPLADEYLTVTPDTADDVDYIGIAGHNFGSGQMPVSVEVLDDSGSPETWTEVISETLLADDGPVLFRFTKGVYPAVRVRIQPSLLAVQVTPFAAVLYAGELLILQRRIYVGHTPIPYGRQLNLANHRSISGAFLGRIVLSETVAASVEMQNLTPAWYRANFEPFLQAARETPFFFGWRPSTYPREIGFAWLTGDPKPQNESANGLMSISFDMEGIVK